MDSKLNTLLVISIILSTWGMGALLNEYFRTKKVYEDISRQIFIRNEKWNNYLGVFLFKSFVTKTFYSKINTSIKVRSCSIEELKRVKKIIIDSEIGHTIAFSISELIFISLGYIDIAFIILGTVLNILLNGYPLLLQQMNKRRINEVLRKYNYKSKYRSSNGKY